MKIAFQNFLTTLKRYRTASILNIAGLTIAFIVFYILVAQVHHGLMYNSTIPDYERVYVTVAKTSVVQDYYTMGVGRPQTEMTIAQVPEVEAGGVITTGAEQLSIHKLNNGHYDCYDLKSALATPSALEALSLQLIAGDIEQFKIPNKVIISDRAAKQMKIGLGDMVYYGKAYDNNIDFKPALSCEVVGIYRAFAKNSLFAEMDAVRCGKEDEFNKVYQAKFTGIVKLRPDADTEKFEKLWMENYSKQITKDLGDGAIAPKGSEMHLVSLKNLYFAPYDFTDRGNLNLGEDHNNPTAVYSQLAIAILIVLIAFINFINFFFALIPVRIRAVNISKVFGATNRSLRWSFMFEALALTLISLGLALYLMIAVPDTPIANFVSCSLALRDNIATIGWILLAVVVLALTAAL
ncbi:MAG: hypothetical protein IKY80_03090, partial [Alistipes sp.]|nr:hypothetical protein [Alistipes sp.]